ncbi:MAG: ABC transporter permease [Acidobacteria bacterium]|nr:ABC transporter permease [Acidobacteriota bacterium]
MATTDELQDPSADRMVAARTPRQLATARLRKDYVALASAIFIVLLVIFALLGPVFEAWTGHPVNTSNSTGVDDYTLVPVGPMSGCENGLASVGERACFVLGASNNLGYDMLVQLSYGARTSLIIGLVATFLTLVVALLLGVIAGYVGGWTDAVIARTMDVVAAFPFLLFAVAASVAIGPSMWFVIIVIAFFSWFYPGRIFRGEVMSLRSREFVTAARMLGASNRRIIFRHLMPQLIGPLTVYASLSVAAAIAAEAALSYLGFGLPLDVPSWGRMIADAVPGGLYVNAPFLMIFPGTLLVLTVLAFNLLGDGLRDALDPRGGSNQ